MKEEKELIANNNQIKFFYFAKMLNETNLTDKNKIQIILRNCSQSLLISVKLHL
jgi:hypothetical protein